MSSHLHVSVLHLGAGLGTTSRGSMFLCPFNAASTVANLKQTVAEREIAGQKTIPQGADATSKPSVNSISALVARQLVVCKGSVLQEEISLRSANVQMNDFVTVLILPSDTSGWEEPVEPIDLAKLQEIQQSGVVDAALMKLKAISPQLLAPLVEMGFSEQRALKALLLNFFNPQLAIEWLFVHAQDEDIDEPVGAQHLMALGLGGNLSSAAIPDQVEKAIGKMQCTFSVTGSQYAPQPLYHCRTCNLVDGRGCCVVCAKTCHAGHDLSAPLASSSFYCDCGSGDAPSPCRALKARSSLSPLQSVNPGDMSAEKKEKAATEAASLSKHLNSVFGRQPRSEPDVDTSAIRRALSSTGSSSEHLQVFAGLNEPERDLLDGLLRFFSSDKFQSAAQKPRLPDQGNALRLLAKLYSLSGSASADERAMVFSLLSLAVLCEEAAGLLVDKTGGSIIKDVLTFMQSGPDFADLRLAFFTFLLNTSFMALSASAASISKHFVIFYPKIVGSKVVVQCLAREDPQSDSLRLRLLITSLLSNLAHIPNLPEPNLRSIFVHLVAVIQEEDDAGVMEDAVLALGSVILQHHPLRMHAASLDVGDIVNSSCRRLSQSAGSGQLRRLSQVASMFGRLIQQ